MARFRLGRTVGYRRLRALVDCGLLSLQRLVYGQPALYTATRDGLAWAGISQLEPARVGVATTRHWATCARLAVQLERLERVEVWGEPRLRAAELEADRAIASAQLCRLPDGRPRLRRPDLVLFPDCGVAGGGRGRAVDQGRAAARRDLPRAGALPVVSEVCYYAPPHVARAVSRAVSSVRAHDAIRILPLQEPEEVHVVRFTA